MSTLESVIYAKVFSNYRTFFPYRAVSEKEKNEKPNTECTLSGCDWLYARASVLPHDPPNTWRIQQKRNVDSYNVHSTRTSLGMKSSPAILEFPSALLAFQCHWQDPRWCYPPSMHGVCSYQHLAEKKN